MSKLAECITLFKALGLTHEEFKDAIKIQNEIEDLQKHMQTLQSKLVEFNKGLNRKKHEKSDIGWDLNAHDVYFADRHKRRK